MNGLRNLGNTCYMNAGIQMLINNKELCTVIYQEDNSNKFVRILQQFIKVYHSNNQKVLNPSFIKEYMGKLNEEFYGFNQNDSSEFITLFLDNLNKILGNNIIDNIFRIKINNTVKCKMLDCLHKRNNTETSVKLMLNIEKHFTDLDDCYRHFKKSEKLDRDNMVDCEKCKKKTIVSRKAEIIEWPDNLLVVLKRFNFNSGGRLSKNSQTIKVPLEWRRGYQLHGVVFHSGSTSGGHYVYIGNNNNEWYLYNDDSVTKINNSTQLNNYINNGYIYYFKKFRT